MAKQSYKAELETYVSGIPCLIGVHNFLSVPGNPSTWDSDWDYYGYTEMDWEILDRKGYKADWLQRKLTKEDESRIEQEIIDFFADRGGDCDDDYDYDY